MNDNAKYQPSAALLADIENRFTYHRPNNDQPQRYTALRDEAKKLALLIVSSVPPGRECSLALTKLEEAVMFANAGIAREPGTPVEPPVR